jgi:hypothetical protein
MFNFNHQFSDHEKSAVACFLTVDDSGFYRRKKNKSSGESAGF